MRGPIAEGRPESASIPWSDASGRAKSCCREPTSPRGNRSRNTVRSDDCSSRGRVGPVVRSCIQSGEIAQPGRRGRRPAIPDNPRLHPSHVAIHNCSVWSGNNAFRAFFGSGAQRARMVSVSWRGSSAYCAKVAVGTLAIRRFLQRFAIPELFSRRYLPWPYRPDDDCAIFNAGFSSGWRPARPRSGGRCPQPPHWARDPPEWRSPHLPPPGGWW